MEKIQRDREHPRKMANENCLPVLSASRSGIADCLIWVWESRSCTPLNWDMVVLFVGTLMLVGAASRFMAGESAAPALLISENVMKSKPYAHLPRPLRSSAKTIKGLPYRFHPDDRNSFIKIYAKFRQKL